MNHFDAAYLAAAPFLLASAYWKRWRHGKYRRSLPGMFGANLPSPPLPAVRQRVWMHSVSVGETIASGAVFRVLRAQRPEWEFLSTTTTETGQDQARRSLAEATYHDFVPVDLSWKVHGFLNAYQPSVYLFFETEIWPNILRQCRQRRMPVFLVNGKLSERSAGRYEMARPLLGRSFGAVTAFLMQTQHDAERMRRIVGPDVPIHVTGNVKFDNLPEPLAPERRAELRRAFGVTDSQLLFLAGSTHKEEERLILQAFAAYRSHNGPPARLAIAPRHPERFNDVAIEIEKQGFQVYRSSSNAGAPSEENVVVLMDEMGVLARNFGAADVALLGGSWAPIGGHNLLEPGAHGIPVIHGPHMHAQKEITRIMRRHKASREVPADLIDEELIRLANSVAARRELGDAALHAANANKGAAHRAVEIILEKLGT